jgi:serine/threonine-protein kinase
MLGTPRYMSPEQVASAKDVDERTDLWAMGLILYELLTGMYPFEGSSSGQILSAILTQSIRPLRDLRPEASPELEQVVTRSLAKNRDDRFQECRHMIRALTPFASRRMQSVVSEQDEVDGEATATVKAPDAVSASTPAMAPTTPVGRDAAAATRGHPPDGAAAAPDPQKSAAATRISGGSSTTRASGASSASREPAPDAAPPPPQTDTSMFADSSPARRSTWKVGAAALLAAGVGGVVFWLATRDPQQPAPSAAQAASSADVAHASARAVESSSTTGGETVITPVFPRAVTSASASSSPSSVAPSASAAPAAASPITPRPRPSTTSRPGSSGVRLDTRD